MTSPLFDPAAEGWVQRETKGFSGLVGPLWVRDEAEGRSYGFLAGPQHANNRGMVHGGMLATLADNSLGLVVRDAAEGRGGVTMQLNLHYMAAARPGDFIIARGEVMRKGRSTVFVRGELTVEGKRVLAADGIWKLFD